MIKLSALIPTSKTTINEFELMGSKLRQQSDPGEMFAEYLCDDLPTSLLSQINSLIEGDWDDDEDNDEIQKIKMKPLPPKLISQLLKASDKIIVRSGTKVVARYKQSAEENRVAYMLFDFSKPAYGGKFCIGLMWNSEFKSNVSYSPKKTFDIPKIERVHYTHLATEYIGQGYGKFLYDSVISYLGAMISDNTLFQESYNMWTTHIRNKAKFFGIMVGTETTETSDTDLEDNRVIIPVPDGSTINKSELRRLHGTNGFIAIFGSVPSIIKKMSGLFAVDQISDIAAVYVNSDFTSKIQDIFDDADTHEELYNDNTIDYLITADKTNTASITQIVTVAWLFRNCTVVTTQTTEGLDYTIV